jgi:hypothetical protein
MSKHHWLHGRYRWMIGAVYNPNHTDYPWASQYDCDWSYGPGQFQDFVEFVESTLGKPTATHKYLSRKDQRQGFTKKNLCWQSGKELCNKHINGTRPLKFKNKTKTLTQWADEYGIGYHTVRTRLEYGWTVKDALTQPVRDYDSSKL